MLDAIKHITDDIFSFRKTAHWCTCTVHATQSNCCGALDFLSPKPYPDSLELNALITRFREFTWVFVINSEYDFILETVAWKAYLRLTEP